MNKRKIIMMALSVMMVAILAVGGSLAYFLDTDSATNVFTVGNVKIQQNEVDENDEPFEQNQVVMPIIDAGDKYNDPNYIWKKVSVENTGASAAYVRTFIAFPLIMDNNNNKAYDNWLHWNGSSATDAAPYINDWYWDKNLTVDWPGNNEGWNCFEAEIEGDDYMVYVVTHKTAVAAGAETGCSLRGFYLDSAVDCEVGDDGSLNYFYYPLQADGTRSETKVNLGDISTLKIPVFSQAVQAEGFEDENGNGSAADEAFAASGLPENPWA